MIPTTATSSPSTATISSSNNNINGQQNSSSAMIGIASLILEGRAIDEYQTHPPRTVADAVVKDGVSASAHHGSATAAASGNGGFAGAGRQSPQPSTSRAATSASTSGHVINITTNPHAFGFTTAPLFIDPYNSSSASSSAESTHQRWTQKLCQLRQASPAASHSPAYEQKIAIEAQSSTGEPELVALAINESSSDRGDFEILRRVMLNRANVPSGNATAGSASSSPGSGSENFLHSLQSLATTCLRGGSPSSVESGYRYSALSTPPLAPPVIATATPKYNYRATPPRFQSPYVMDVPGSASSSGSGIQSPRLAWSPALNIGGESSSSARDKYLKQTSGRIQIPATVTSLSNTASSSAISITPTTTTKGGANAAAAASAYPHQGPHCDQFLRKMGLAKGEATETEDHFCDMSYVNITCSRWRAYCLKMEAIIARGEPMCIEVYLGPVGHKILLEQWIITQKEKVPPPTMTLSSLCSAIRSQLYFSQISAWCDLIKKSDTTIYDTGRIIIPTATGAAGDLATAAGSPNANVNNVTPGSSPSTTSSSPINQLTNAMLLNRRPRLNIFYRIKQYDSTACFNSKPNVHNFPNVNISENFSISVSLKSLPRMNGGIPKIGSSMPTSAAEVGVTNGANATNSKAATSSSHIVAPPPSLQPSQPTETPRTSRPSAAALSVTLNCDNNNKNGRTISTSSVSSPLSTVINTASYGNGKHKATTFFIDEEELLDEIDAGEDDDNARDFANGAGDSSNSSFSSNANLSHRERQLLKYRKRMQKRDKKPRNPEVDSGEVHSNGVVTTCQPMEQGDEEVHHGASLTAPTSHIEMISTGTQTQMTCCQQCGSEKTLVCLNCNGCHGFSSIELDEMDSSSSLSSSDIIHTPRNKAELLLAAIQRTPKAAKHKKQTMRSTLSVVDTASPHHLQQNNNHLNASASGVNASASSCQVCKRQKTQHNFSGRSRESGEESTELVSVEDEENGDGKGSNIVDDECDRSTYTVADNDPSHIMEEESFISSTKLTPHIDRCTLSTSSLAIQERAAGDDRSSTPPMTINSATESASVQFKTPTNHQQQQQQLFQHKHTPKPPNLLQLSSHYHSAAGGDGRTTCRLATHANGTTTLIYEGTPPPTQNPMYLRKGLPKVNLTPIFCNPSNTITTSLSAPIPIENCRSTSEANFSFDQTTINRSARHGLSIPVIDNNIPVQKSYSAPTLPNSPSLSPRFAKQAAIYKRRSRHLSDRSDRSSLGSDEQFSDEDLENGMYSPAATSPMKQRSRIAAVFGRLPLLGNLEESLLQKRLLPKIEVMGFKVLLGASGGFCPTQLTIPAASYFYELHGEALSTPYVCEIRLPRKGYSVPRAGTVQATLLNPMGTVVRMFVVSYDMRDMPPLHQTFIRQRILAEASSNETATLQNNNGNNSIVNGFTSASENGNNNPTNNNNNNNNKYRLSPSGGLHGESNLGHFISAEHMKRLRYSIHLRFQTSRSGRLSLHTDIRLLISRRTDCDTAAAHAKGVLEAPNDLVTDTVMPTNPKYSARQEAPNKI